MKESWHFQRFFSSSYLTGRSLSTDELCFRDLTEYGIHFKTEETVDAAFN